MSASDRTYIIVVDAWNPAVDPAPVKDFVRNSKSITNWWNYIPYVFLVTSPLRADQLSEEMRPYTKGARFLVMRVNPAESEGSLPRRSWEWIGRIGDGQAPIGALTQAAMAAGADNADN
jgi:hypothetical protein